MAENGRQPNGTFAPGHGFSKGRPPRDYSIAHQLRELAHEESTDDAGTQKKRLAIACERIWAMLVTGKWRGEEVALRDYLAAFQEIGRRLEPDYKMKIEDAIDDADGDKGVKIVLERKTV